MPQSARGRHESAWGAWRPGGAAWRIAREPRVVRRALGFAVVVGALLITINHGDALVAGEVTARRLLKMGLTVLVPYCVSTLSSVGARLEADARALDRGPAGA